MRITDITKDLRNERDSRLVSKLDRLMRSPRYKTINDENKEVILSIIRKYKERAKKGLTISTRMIKEDRSYLYKNRAKLDLSKVDRQQIFNLLDSFKE